MASLVTTTVAGTLTATGNITTNSTGHAAMMINSSAADKSTWLYLQQGSSTRWLSGVEASKTRYELYSAVAGSGVAAPGVKFHLDTSGNGTFSGGLTATTAAFEASGLAINLNTPSASQNCWVTWQDNGANKWEIGKNTANKLYIHNYAASESALEFDAASHATFGGQVTFTDDLYITTDQNIHWSGNYSFISGNGANTTGNLRFYTSDTLRLTIAGNGAATFSGTVTTTGLQSTDWIEVRNDAAEYYLTNAANTRYWRQRIAANGSDYDYILDHYNGTSSIAPLTISQHGVATFSGAVTTAALTATTGSFAGHVTPASNISYDLGASSLRWNGLYANTGSFNGTLTASGNITGGANITGAAFGSINLTSSTQHVKWPFTSGQSASRSWGWIGEQGSYGWFQLYRSDASDGTLDTEVLRFDNLSKATFNGNVTVSNTAPKLILKDTDYGANNTFNMEFNGGVSGFSTTNANTYFSFTGGGNEFARIGGDGNDHTYFAVRGTGNMGVGTTTPGNWKLYVNGDFYTDGDAAINGGIQSGTTTPGSNLGYDIGTTSLRWNALYANTGNFSGTATFAGNVSITTASTCQLTLLGGGTDYINAGLVLKSSYATNVRGLGVFMHSAATLAPVEWYAGTPYSSSDRYIIARKGSQASHSTAVAVTANALLTVSSSGSLTVGSFSTNSSGDISCRDVSPRDIIDADDISCSTAYIGGSGSPQTALQVGDYTDAAETITIATSQNGTGRINFYDNNNTEGGSLRVVGETSGCKMHFANRWNTDADKITFDLVNGRVGIGNDAPNYMLDVSGDIRIGKGQSTGVLHSGGDLQFYADGAKVIEMFTSGSNYIFKSFHDVVYFGESNIKFGIGTTQPGTKLEIVQDGAFASGQSVALQIASALLAFEGNNDMRLYFHENGTTYRGMMGYAHAGSTYMGIWDNSSNVDPTLVCQSGEVGIGTNSPSSKLSVVKNFVGSSVYANFGPTTLSGADTREGGIQIHASSGTNDKTWGVWADANNPVGLRFEYLATRATAFGSGTSVLTLDGVNDRVGIGTDTPGAKLHVYGGSIRISSTDDKPQLEFFETAAARWVIGHSNAPNNYFAISEGSDIAASERLVIAPTTGSVGIGTISPSKLLEVNGPIRATNSTTGGKSYFYMGAVKPGETYEYDAGGMSAIYPTSAWNSLVVSLLGPSLNGYSAPLEYMTFSSNGTTQLTSMNGSVGIGATPDTALTVLKVSGNVFNVKGQGSANVLNIGATGVTTITGASGGTIFNLTNSGAGDYMNLGTTAFHVKKDGNVGMGTGSPQQLLHLKSNDPKIYLEDGNAGTNEKVYAIYPAGSQYVLQTLTDAYGTGENVFIVDRTGTTVDKTTFSNGDLIINDNVGIGTGSPAGPLHVYDNYAGERNINFDNYNASGVMQVNIRAGTSNEYLSLSRTTTLAALWVASDPFIIKHHHSSAWHDSITIDSAGEVGINRSDPSYNLDVNGTGRYTGQLTLDTVSYTHLTLPTNREV